VGFSFISPEINALILSLPFKKVLLTSASREVLKAAFGFFSLALSTLPDAFDTHLDMFIEGEPTSKVAVEHQEPASPPVLLVPFHMSSDSRF
jgi:hypothetical protein